MRHNFFIFSTILFIFSTGIFAKDVKRVKNKTEPVYLKTNNSRPQLFRSSVSDPVFGSSTRQEFDLITDDFEGDVSGWEAEGGWELTNTDFNSSNSSFRSPDQVYYDTDGVTPISINSLYTALISNTRVIWRLIVWLSNIFVLSIK